MNYYLKVLQNYATFSGRARRSEYWYFTLFNFIIAIVVGFVNVLTKMPISTIYYLAVLIPTIAVGVRRMHDVGKSGWFILIPIYNLILACTDGINGDNEYGADPKMFQEMKVFDIFTKLKTKTMKNEQLNHVSKAASTAAVSKTTVEKASPVAGNNNDLIITLLLWFFLGGLAAHRWYKGKPVGWNILFILTAGGCGIWAIVDLVNILKGTF